MLTILSKTKVNGGEIYDFPITTGEVFRRDRLTVDEGEHKCIPDSPGPPAVTATCTASATSQESRPFTLSQLIPNSQTSNTSGLLF